MHVRRLGGFTRVWGFIRLHAISPSPWKGDGSLTIKPPSFHSPKYYLVVYIISRLRETSQDELINTEHRSLVETSQYVYFATCERWIRSQGAIK